MAWTEITGNTTTLTGGSTEDSIIAAQTAAGMYVVAVDLNAMVNGDVIEVRIYTKVRTGATARVIGRWAFSNVQSDPNWQSPPVFVGTGDIAVKMVQSAGTGRAVITTLIGDPGGLEPTTVGRKLDVSAGGEAGIDWANIGSPTTAQNLSGTNIDTDQVVASVAGAVGSVAANGISASSLAADAGAEIADAVWDEALAGHAGAGSAGAALSAAGAAGDPWATALPGAYSAGTAGKIVDDNVNATVSSRASQTTADAIETDTQDIQGRLPVALVGGRIDATVDATGLESGAADSIWDEPLSDSVPADGALPTARQSLYMITQFLMERSVSGVTMTVKKVDGSATLMTFTLNDADAPTSITRAS